MNAAINRFRWLAPLLAAMALALAPQFAAAHSSHADEPDAAALLAGDRAAPVPGAAAPQPVSAAWSPSCPSGHGSGCCCHVPVACTGGNQNPVVNVGGWTRPVPLLAGRGGRLPVKPPLPQSQIALSPALPRAPPFFS